MIFLLPSLSRGMQISDRWFRRVVLLAIVLPGVADVSVVSVTLANDKAVWSPTVATLAGRQASSKLFKSTERDQASASGRQKRCDGSLPWLTLVSHLKKQTNKWQVTETRIITRSCSHAAWFCWMLHRMQSKIHLLHMDTAWRLTIGCPSHWNVGCPSSDA